jgi:glutamate-1-semialdehyde 2,1-aminomutase
MSGAELLVNESELPNISQSEDLYKRSEGLIPGFTQTLAKGPTQYVHGVAPIYLQKGKGCRVWDVDGNEYLDFNAAIGPLSLGYCYDRVDNAIKQQLESGISFSLPHSLEVEAAELLRKVLPSAEAIRFAKTGAEATAAAVRLARAYTSREKVLCCGYHGWHDWYIGLTSRNKGVPKSTADLTQSFTYNDLDSVKELLDEDTACVILEPMIFDWPQDYFLEGLQELCSANGTLLIFDEMWTGFRWALGGAQEFFKIKADLACYSKAVANGMPIAVLAGRRKIMDLLADEVFFYSTFGGETLSLAALIATVNELRDRNVPDWLARRGDKLLKGYNQIAAEQGMHEITHCKGHPSRALVVFEAPGHESLLMKSLVQQELIRRGILWSGFHNLSYTHNDSVIDQLLEAYSEVLPLLKKALEEGNLEKYIKGKPVQPVFRKV